MTGLSHRQEQLLLPFARFDPLEFDSYLPGRNHLAVEHIIRQASGRESNNIFLWGASGVGKSHLLQAACHLAGQHKLTSVYIPFGRADEFVPDMLDNLDVLDLVSIDDVDAIAGQAAWEHAVFNLFNQLKAAATPLLMSARTNPVVSAIMLEDLRSRFVGDHVYHLQSLDDGGKKQALQLRADYRGFEIPDEVADYLLSHIPRDVPGILSWLDRLDDSTLIAQKKLTVPFVRELLHTGQGGGAG